MRIKLWLLAHVCVATAAACLALGSPLCRAADVVLQEEVPDDVKRQIEEQTANLPDEIREKAREQITEQIRKQINGEAPENSTVVVSPDGEGAATSDTASATPDGDSAKEEAKDKPGEEEKPAGDPLSDESKKLRAEIELEATRFRHKIAMYEKDLEDKRVEIEKAKIDRKLEAEANAEKIAGLQQELERLKLETELQKKRAEAEEVKLDAELAKAKAEKAKIEHALQAEDMKEKLEERVLGDEQFPDEPFNDGVLTISLRRIELNGPIFAGAADYVCQRLDYFNNQSDKPIFLVIDECPGGSATEGFQIVQAIKNSKAPVHVVVKRMAASMGAIIATLAEHSYCYPDAIILHHQGSTMLAGNGRGMEDQLRQFKEISKRLVGAVAEKIGMSEEDFVDQWPAPSVRRASARCRPGCARRRR
jgi:ATP-dependent protease ClpP protease subunit